VWSNYDTARWRGVRDVAHEKLYVLLTDDIPEVRLGISLLTMTGLTVISVYTLRPKSRIAEQSCVNAIVRQLNATQYKKKTETSTAVKITAGLSIKLSIDMVKKVNGAMSQRGIGVGAHLPFFAR